MAVALRVSVELGEPGDDRSLTCGIGPGQIKRAISLLFQESKTDLFMIFSA
jgi:hypothetical protein